MLDIKVVPITDPDSNVHLSVDDLIPFIEVNIGLRGYNGSITSTFWWLFAVSDWL